jgi:hypothetical protein
MKIEGSTFVAAVRQCYKYGKFGHISKFCAKEKQFFSCGKANHEASCVEKCLNYNGHHRTNRERFPVIKNRRNSIKLLLIEMSNFSKHRQL